MPDPRQARGVRYPWWVLLTTVLAAMLAGCDQVRAMAQWARDHAQELAAVLPLPRGRVPSECTLQRALRAVDPITLGGLLCTAQQVAPTAVVLEPLALDGKSLRAASTTTQPLHVLELARHSDGALARVLGVGRKQNEYSASPALLADFDLRNRVITGDAMFCQRPLAQFITQRGGQWLFAVKDNQPHLAEAIADHFAGPRGGPYPLDIRSCRTAGQAHGRQERRLLEVSSDLAEHLDWPAAQQVIRRTMVRCVEGHESLEYSYWVTNLTPEQADAELLERLCRGHWTIENQVNWCRDMTFGEDR
jgi:predicted transposase YbfD/YdcC